MIESSDDRTEIERAVRRLMRGMGRDVGELVPALTKTEVTAILSMAAPLVGAYPIPEFPTKPMNAAENALDVAWAVRSNNFEDAAHGTWLPVAAFEVDGQDIDDPGKKLVAFSRVRPQEPIVRAHILFRVGEDGIWWSDRDRSARQRLLRDEPTNAQHRATESRDYLAKVVGARRDDVRAPTWLRDKLDVLLDAELEVHLRRWIAAARVEVRALISSGRGVAGE